MADILRMQVADEEEEQSEKSLRPKSFAEMIGRAKEKQMLSISINAAKARKEPLDHIIFHGPPGLGKTSFAHVIANEMGANIHVTSGPAIERAGDLASIISNLGEGDILFIDEIHRLHKVVEEVLYPAMEDYALDIVLGKGVGAKSVRIELPRFTVIGATTKIGALTHALRDRFGTVFRLEFYSNDELTQLVKQKAKILNTPVDDKAAEAIAQRSRGTARISLRLLKRVRDHAHHLGKKKVDVEAVNESMKLLQVDELGLDENDKKILRLIIENFKGGPVGLNTIAAAISEEEDTIVDVYEPYLIQQGFLNRTPKGRTATQKAYEYLGVKEPKSPTLL